MSELMSLTFSDNPDAARGKDAFDLILKKQVHLDLQVCKDSYKASEDCVMDGDVKTGLITIFGTSGIWWSTADYAEMH
jgi:hypothetical protein